MAGVRRSAAMKNRNGVRCASGNGRPIPVRGQVKIAIVLGLAQSVASFFSSNGRSKKDEHHLGIGRVLEREIISRKWKIRSGCMEADIDTVGNHLQSKLGTDYAPEIEDAD
ncbi:unnamed protein product [Lactuca saligna]|uniref:Uncharacterized protein n=1 Tax=Lactuca saligna TaxID=75948 RepID=A0AA35VE91_LACSI|nr:unnamed protein product [Lactuca saligna]